MEESQLAAQLQFLVSLKNTIYSLQRDFGPFVNENYKKIFVESAKALWDQYFKTYSFINELLGFDTHRGLQPIINPTSDTYEKWFATLRVLIPQIDKGIGGLQSKISPLPSNEILKLGTLKKEIQGILQEMHEEYHKNIQEAIEEAEKGHFLGSVLISGRVIVHAFEQIPGNTVQNKIATLKEVGLVEKKGEVPLEYIIKADRKARHYFSHDIKAFPDGSEALELLAICVRVLKLLKNYKSKEKV